MIRPTTTTPAPAPPMPAPGERLACSWSGGKDSCLALHRAVEAGATVTHLLTMCTESGERTRSHGLHVAVIRAQAAALGADSMTASAAWADYRELMIDALRALNLGGFCRGAVFGDIDIDAHRAWEDGVCGEAGMTAYLPLWQGERRALLGEFLAAGYEARIVAVRDGVLDPALLGRVIDERLIGEIEAAGADACGENGEYHSVVVDGPLFQRRVELIPGQRVLRDGVWFLDFTVAPGITGDGHG